MEFDQIKELISLVNSTDLVEVNIKDKDFQLRIRKEGKPTLLSPISTQIEEQAKITPTSAEPREVSIQQNPSWHEVTAPMVGTFYRAPSPDSPPYVQVGDTISEGQTLFIIEAMKMMNEIEAEFKGVVKEILVENGEPVQYGQPLLLIDPEV